MAERLVIACEGLRQCFSEDFIYAMNNYTTYCFIIKKDVTSIFESELKAKNIPFEIRECVKEWVEILGSCYHFGVFFTERGENPMRDILAKYCNSYAEVPQHQSRVFWLKNALHKKTTGIYSRVLNNHLEKAFSYFDFVCNVWKYGLDIEVPVLLSSFKTKDFNIVFNNTKEEEKI